jgi:ribosomal protein S18 acetylase RimI-like enzyme
MTTKKIIIRKFSREDRKAVRRIACETAFWGSSRYEFFEDDKILADLLTKYYTDYEPDYCFVAAYNNTVVGYLTGAGNVSVMNRIFYFRIIPKLVLKSISRGLFIKKNTSKFLFHCLGSFFRGEFSAPDVSSKYPATLHINIDKDFQSLGIGRNLVGKYLAFLKEEKVSGVHFGTASEGAKIFFIKMGFKLLSTRKRTYLRYKTGKEQIYYVFGKEI